MGEEGVGISDHDDERLIILALGAACSVFPAARSL